MYPSDISCTIMQGLFLCTSLPLRNFAIFGWGNPHHFFKESGEVVGIGYADRASDFLDREGGQVEHLARFLYFET